MIYGLKDKSIDCVVTSPPYWGLRDYKTEPIIFDGLPDCEHDFNIETEAGDLRFRGANAAVGNNKNPDVNNGNGIGIFCSKCGAWKGQLGLEPTPELFIKHLLDFFDDVRLKLRDEGNVFINLGDTYAGSGCGTNDYRTEASKSINGVGKNAALYKTGGLAQKIKSIPAKSKCLIPERFAIGMVDRGWILRNEIIWAKPNHMPESVTDRLTKAHEVIYHFVKQGKYYYDLDAIREPHKVCGVTGHRPMGILRQKLYPDSSYNKSDDPHLKQYRGKFDGNGDSESFGSPRARTQRKPYAVQERTKEFVEYRLNLPNLDDLRFFLNKHRVLKDLTMDEVEQMFGNMAAHHWFGGECYPSPEDWIKLKDILGFDGEYDEVMTQEFIKPSDKVNNPKGKNPGDIWYITTQPYSEAHFATFPLELVRRPILAGCPVGGTVLDPFAGSGTVGEFCRYNDRNAILFELNPDYKKLIEDRAMLLVPELSNWVVGAQ